MPCDMVASAALCTCRCHACSMIGWASLVLFALPGCQVACCQRTDMLMMTLWVMCCQAAGRKVMVATSAAEEGLDVPSCEFVVRYHAAVSGKQRMQSKGRSRKIGGQYIEIVQQDNTKEVFLHKKSYTEEQNLHKFLEEVSGKPRAGAGGFVTEEQPDLR